MLAKLLQLPPSIMMRTERSFTTPFVMRTSQTKPRIQEEEKPRIQEEKLNLKKTRPGRSFKLQGEVLPRWPRYYRAAVLSLLLPHLLPRATEEVRKWLR